jgi:hypothetical protein
LAATFAAFLFPESLSFLSRVNIAHPRSSRYFINEFGQMRAVFPANCTQ